MKKKFILLILTIIIISFITVALLLYNGTILLNNPSKEKYPVRGIDISSYQGEVDWDIIKSQNIQFAFIKATEGSTFIDPYFKTNYKSAIATELRIGAYHFFSYDSDGETQANNFISIVPKTENMLPPVIDIEFYGDKEENLPDEAKTKEELSVLLTKLEEYYGMKPIIYATEKSYELYIVKSFNEYDIWIRDVIFMPRLSDNRTWTFWQYTNREKLEGYSGDEKYIDMNVFCGSKDEFDVYPEK